MGPWGRLKTFLSMQKGGVQADVSDDNGMSSIAASYQVVEASHEALAVRCTYLVHSPHLRLHLLLSLRKGNFEFYAAVEFDETYASGGMLSYATVQRFMSKGFLTASSHLGKTLLAELVKRGRE